MNWVSLNFIDDKRDAYYNACVAPSSWKDFCSSVSLNDKSSLFPAKFWWAFSKEIFLEPIHSVVYSKWMSPLQAIDLKPGLLSKQISESAMSMTKDIFGTLSGSVVNPVGLSTEFSLYLGKALAKKV